jgi:eukaryotic-like serine/threonine-protein kinase
MSLPSRIDRYDILGELGKGGMAVVYRAIDTRLMREVALKVIRTDTVDPSEQHELHRRLENEARAVAMLHHHGIVTIFDQGEFEGQSYIAMELIEGQTLGHLIRDQRLTTQETVSILRDVATALDFAHNKKVIHRDVKPANILVQPDGKPKITDFGIAKVDVLAATRTTTGTLVGSLHYMAPEQIEAKPCTPATDQWGLAITAFECLSGRRPFESDTIVALCRQICDKPAPNLTEFNPKLPERANTCLARALDKDPQRRYSTCSEFVSELTAAFQVVRPPIAEPVTRPFPALQPKPRSAAGIFAGAALVLVIVAGAIMVATRGKNQSAVNHDPATVARSVAPPQSPPNPEVSKLPADRFSAVPAGPAQPLAKPSNTEGSPASPKNIAIPSPKVKPPAAPPQQPAAAAFVPLPRPQTPPQPGAEELKSLAETYMKNALQARDQRDFNTAKDAFVKAAAAGNGEAMRNLGLLYQNGQGVSQDLAEAMKWYSKAADAGNMVAMYNIGRLYQTGLGVPQDVAEAKKWYSKSALLGFPDAQQMLRVLTPPPSPPPANPSTPNPTPAVAPANGSTATGTQSAAPRQAGPGSQLSSNVYAVGGDVSNPSLISKVDPDYTEQARAAKLEGDVLLYVEIGADGVAHNVKVLRPLGLGLDEKAMDAVKKWKFKPGYRNGQPVTVGAQIKVSFHLL